mgnify:CR=1 FL=1
MTFNFLIRIKKYWWWWLVVVVVVLRKTNFHLMLTSFDVIIDKNWRNSSEKHYFHSKWSFFKLLNWCFLVCFVYFYIIVSKIQAQKYEILQKNVFIFPEYSWIGIFGNIPSCYICLVQKIFRNSIFFLFFAFSYLFVFFCCYAKKTRMKNDFNVKIVSSQTCVYGHHL